MFCSVPVHVLGDSNAGLWCAKMKMDTLPIIVIQEQNQMSKDRVNRGPALSGPMAAGVR